MEDFNLYLILLLSGIILGAWLALGRLRLNAYAPTYGGEHLASRAERPQGNSFILILLLVVAALIFFSKLEGGTALWDTTTPSTAPTMKSSWAAYNTKKSSKKIAKNQNWYWQVGAFTDYNNARDLHRHLVEQGHRVEMFNSTEDSYLCRIAIGDFSTSQAAQDYATQHQLKGVLYKHFI